MAADRDRDRPRISLVIPGRNCAKTLAACLESVVPLVDSGELLEIVFVDDGSRDDTAAIAARYPVRVIQGDGRGPGYARNLGWRAAGGAWVWFIDSDCVAEDTALKWLVSHLQDDSVAGVGGSYANLYPDSLVATLIHEEIVARHREMPDEVDFLATFNVLYRRRVLDETGGFDESLKLAQDAELAFRVRAAGYRLRFDCRSRVGHHHPREFLRYLRTQCRQGRYRMLLYRRHPGKMTGDNYAGWSDFAQPPLAMLAAAAAPLAWLGLAGTLATVVLSVTLLALQWPMARRIARGAGWRVALSFVPFSTIRAFARGVGAAWGASSLVLGKSG